MVEVLIVAVVVLAVLVVFAVIIFLAIVIVSLMRRKRTNSVDDPGKTEPPEK